MYITVYKNLSDGLAWLGQSKIHITNILEDSFLKEKNKLSKHDASQPAKKEEIQLPNLTFLSLCVSQFLLSIFSHCILYKVKKCNHSFFFSMLFSLSFHNCLFHDLALKTFKLYRTDVDSILFTTVTVHCAVVRVRSTSLYIQKENPYSSSCSKDLV